MGQRWFWVVLIALGACFSPKFNDGAIQCGPDQLCPPGLDCVAGVCRSGDEPIEDAPAGMVSLSVTRGGAGRGGVQSAPVGIDCGSTCTQSFPVGTMVTLTAAPLAGSTFTGWSGGACSGTALTCSITLTSSIVVNADFGVVMRRLTVVAAGNGTGAITSNPAGINCPGVCSFAFPDGAPVVLNAMPTGASTFVGWTAPGTCMGAGTCNFNITADTTVTGSFALDYSVIVAKSGLGSGTVVSTTPPGGINCGTDCNEVYPVNTSVTLAATADGNSTFMGWSGGCTGAGSCVVSVTAAVMVTAMFDLKQFPFSVAIVGNGSVTSSPSGIMCNGINAMTTGDCSENYTTGTMVTLTATASTGSTFSGWSDPNCPGTGTCNVTVTMMSGVTATFTPDVHTLDIAKAGNGDGVVQTSSGAIDCGFDCSESFAFGTSVLLTQVPSAGSVFNGWSAPGCGTAPMCSVTITAPTTVTVTYTLTTHPLTVSVAAGNGAISSLDGGIDCGTDCTETYNYGTIVSLIPKPDVGWEFSQWSGACSGAGACDVRMDQAFTVFALFTRSTYELTVEVAGGGSGLVTSSPSGINCSVGSVGDCTEMYIHDTDVTLTASANAPSLFVGWSGAGCSGTGPCVVDMLSAQTVTATFSPPPNRMFVTSQTFVPGAFGGLSGADTACQNAANATTPPLAGTYRAWLSTPTVNAIDRLGSASGWVRVDGRPFANTRDDVAFGRLYHPARSDERGMDVFDVSVVTATVSGGVYDNLSGNGNCAGFTMTTGTVMSGSSAGTSDVFTSTGSNPCNQPARLYCFGVDRQATVIPPPPTVAVRRAFMRFWTPGAGIADADAQCQADATANNLPGTYRALLATASASALSRFNLTGRNWLRVDHVPVLSSAGDWGNATVQFFNTGPNLSADGTFMWGNYANWIGAPSLTAVGSLASTCSNWTSQTLAITTGNTGRTRINDFVAWFSSINCGFTAGTITCLQE